jgi:hypothetical protein
MVQIESVASFLVKASFAVAFGLIAFSLLWKSLATGPIFQLSEGIVHAKNTKISHKGYIWKTWDGWFPIGLSSDGGLQKWHFTATDKKVVDCITENNKVKLHYKDYVLMPFRYGYSHQVYKCEPEK